MKFLPFLTGLGLSFSLLGCGPDHPPAPLSPPAADLAFAYPRFGPGIGQQIPALQVYELDGTPDQQPVGAPLTLLYVVSLGSHDSVAALPAVLQIGAPGHVQMTVLYSDGLATYKSRLTSFARQLTMANKLAAQFQIPGYWMAVDGPNCAAGILLGATPGTAFLLNSGGIVLLRQEKLDAAPMTRKIQSELTSLGTRPRLAPDITIAGLDQSDLISVFTDPGKVDRARQLLARYRQLAKWTRPYDPLAAEGSTLLQDAVRRGPAATVDLLIAAGADVNYQNKDVGTPLHIAAERGDIQIVNRLLAAGAHLNQQRDVGNGLATGPTPLQIALLNDQMPVARRLMEAGATRNFYVEVALNHTAVVSRYLEFDPSLVNIPDGEDNTPLYYAIATGQANMVKLLLSRGARLSDPQSPWHQAPLTFVICKNRPEIVKLLLDSGADPNQSSDVLSAAVVSNNLQTLHLLIDRGARINAQDPEGNSALDYAAMQGSTAMMDALLAAGANINQPSGVSGGPQGSGIAYRETPLHFAASYGQIMAVERLIEHHAEVNIRDYAGQTPLILAIEYQRGAIRMQTVRLLLAAGADPNIADGGGISATDDAIASGDNALVALLRHDLKPGPSKALAPKQ